MSRGIAGANSIMEITGTNSIRKISEELRKSQRLFFCHSENVEAKLQVYQAGEVFDTIAYVSIPIVAQ